MRAINMYIDLVLLVLLMVGGLMFLPAFIEQTNTPLISFYDDKTLIQPEGEMELNEDRIRKVEVSPNKYEYCQVYNGKMVALMLLIQDEFCPINNIQINGTIYNIDDNWQFERYEKIEATYISTLAPITSADLLVKYKPCTGYWEYEEYSLTGIPAGKDRRYKYYKTDGDYWIYSN